MSKNLIVLLVILATIGGATATTCGVAILFCGYVPRIVADVAFGTVSVVVGLWVLILTFGALIQIMEKE